MKIVVKGRAKRTADPYRDLDVIDERGPRFNQGVVALTCWLAVLTGTWWLASVMGLQLAIGLVFGRRYCLPCVFYFEVVQPRIGEGEVEDSRPPRFANLLGASFLGAATVAHLAGWSTLAAGLTVVVASLATLAVVTGFCVGCSFYRLAARLRGIGSRSRNRLDLADFEVAERSGVVIQFTHPLCTDCRTLEQELSHRGHDLVLVDVTQERWLARKYGVNVVPLALSVAPDGRVLKRIA